MQNALETHTLLCCATAGTDDLCAVCVIAWTARHPMALCAGGPLQGCFLDYASVSTGVAKTSCYVMRP